MANIKVTLDHQINDGMSLTFKAPCDCTAVTGLKIYYPSLTEDTSTTTSKTFTFKDAHGNNLTSIGNLFVSGAYIKVILDTTNSAAYIQNSDTNGYLENKFSNLKAASVQTTLTVTGWTLSGDRYYQTVSVTGVTADTPVVLADCALDGTDLDADAALLEAWGIVSANNVAQGDGTMTFYALSVPSVNVPVNVGVC